MAASEAPGSNVYTHGHHDSVLRSHGQRTAENSAAYLLPYLRPGMTILDVGSGPGTITAGAGIDNLTFEVADVFDLPYPDAAFDVVHAHQVLQHLDDPVAALRSMRRVAKPGGLVAVRDADYSGMFWYPDVPGLERWRELYLAVARSNDGEPDAGRRLSAWAHAAGFDDVTVSAGTWCYTTAEDRAWWSHTWADRIRYSRMAEHALERGLATTAELGELSDAWLSWGADTDGTFVIPHLEVLAVA